MIAHIHALSDRGFKPGKGIGQQGLTAGAALKLEACKAVIPRLKGLQKLLHQPVFPSVSQNVECKAIADVQECFDSPVPCHSNTHTRWRETGLTDPARHHGAADALIGLPFAGCQHAKGADHAPEGEHARITAAFTESPSGALLLAPLLLLQALG